MFVALEGIDASGKATQSKLLAERLGAKLIGFPMYESPTGTLILAHLQRKWDTVVTLVEPPTPGLELLDALVFQCLQLANRMEVAVPISEWAAKGDLVADRYFASGLAYGAADGLDWAFLYRLHAYLPQPDLQLFIDITPEESLKRRPERRDRYEKQPGLMEKVRANYHEIWKEFTASDPIGWKVINGMGTKEETHALICKAVAEWREHDTEVRR